MKTALRWLISHNLRLSFWFVIALALSGCAHQRTAWNAHTILPKGESVASLNVRANDPSVGDVERVRAVFTLLGRHVCPGSSGADVRRVLTDTRWLQRVELYKIEGLAGWIPVRLKSGESVFCMRLCALPPEEKLRKGSIYFRLSGDFWSGQALAFLRGDPNMKDVRLTEYALCFPPSPKAFWNEGRYETFTTAGMTVIEAR